MKYTFRKFINDIHLWLGIGSGILIFLICLSGTILTFEKEIEGIFDEKLTVVPQGEMLSIESMANTLSVNGEVMSVKIGNDSEKPYEFRVKTSPENRRGTVFFVNPYTGETLKPEPTVLNDFFLSMFKLHRWMLVDSSIGRPIVGIATIIFLFLTISGLILWFPKNLKWRNMKQGFKIKFSANWKRINHDLHNTLGFYSSLLLIIMVLTGLNWSFEWYKDGASAVLGAKIFNRGGGPEFESQAQPEEWKTLEEILAVSQTELDYLGETTLRFPSKPEGVYTISKTNPNSMVPVAADNLVLDRNGALLSKNLFSDKPFNEQVAGLIKPLHTGEIFGLYSKILYFLVCLFATSLPVTGTIIWINKLKKKRKKRLNLSSISEETVI